MFTYDDKDYEIVIIKKKTNKNTYIRVNDKLQIVITTNFLASNRYLEKLIEDNRGGIIKMINNSTTKRINNEGFNFLGTKYDIIYTNCKGISFGEEKVFMDKDFDIDKWYKKEAKDIFSKHLEDVYNRYSESIPYPSLRIRKMTTRWGVCNTRSKTITLNLELIKRDVMYLDYVIVHELSHLIEKNHSRDFWSLVEKNYPEYKKIVKEMKSF